MNFSTQIFFNTINHGYRAPILKTSFLWVLPFYMALAVTIGKRCVERYALQFYGTSLIAA